MKSRHELATTFKAIHPDCKFSASAIMREFPQNAVTATTRDLERNSCPYHTNARRLIKCIHKAGVGKDIKASCRALCGKSMCIHPGVEPNSPITWNESCATGKCDSCPKLKIIVPQNKNKEVTFSQWTYGKHQANGKKVFGLFPETCQLKTLVTKLSDSLPKLKLHVYNAHCQWNAHSIARSKLSDKSIITIEDYQQNIEVVHTEMPTS